MPNRFFHAVLTAGVAVALTFALLSTGCSDTVGCSTGANCAPGYSCVSGACELSSGATPTS